ncbi:TetR/AcrR family transcriptional regulator [Ktedonospora formicarum]|nr:TetR/AcrR family transcriptional regulator [Ktedonospora formicarum]
MAGKKSFQPELVLDKAMGLFWKQGYEASSIEDLVQCTGLGRGSLYDTFGGKHELYLAALKRYCAKYDKNIEELREPTESLPAFLERFFQACIQDLLNDPNRRGCFLVNATIEMAPQDPEVKDFVQKALQDIEEGFYRLLIKAQVAGEFAWTHEPHQFAHFLMGSLVSIRALARGGQDRRVLEDMAKTALMVFR